MPIVIWFLVGGAALAAIWCVRKRTHEARVRRREAEATAEWIREQHPARLPQVPRSTPRGVTGDLARTREKETTQHMLS